MSVPLVFSHRQKITPKSAFHRDVAVLIRCCQSVDSLQKSIGFNELLGQTENTLSEFYNPNSHRWVPKIAENPSEYLKSLSNVLVQVNNLIIISSGDLYYVIPLTPVAYKQEGSWWKPYGPLILSFYTVQIST